MLPEEYSRIIYLVTDLIMPLIVGYFLHREKILSDKAANLIIKFNVIVVYTLLTLDTFWHDVCTLARRDWCTFCKAT